MGCYGVYESAEQLCHWWKYGHMNLLVEWEAFACEGSWLVVELECAPN